MKQPDIQELLLNVEGFDWDKGNVTKNWEKHKVSYIECEEVFFNTPFIVESDKTHPSTEDRFYILGKTDKDRLLFIVFTVRKNKIRVISARNMSRKERKIYEQIEKDTKIQE